MSDQGPGMSTGLAYRDLKTPARVNFAFDIVHWAHEIEQGSPQRSYDGGPAVLSEGRNLQEGEKSVYGAALEVMRLYLTGEMNFEDDIEDDSPVDAFQENSKICFFCKDGETS